MKDVSKTEQVLAENQLYRDNDIELILRVWELEGFVLTPEQRKKFRQVTFPDSITRKRRELRHEYPASPEVEAERMRREIEEREYYRNKTKEMSSTTVRYVERTPGVLTPIYETTVITQQEALI